MKNVLRGSAIVTFATAAFASLSGLGSLTVQAQVHEMDLLRACVAGSAWRCRSRRPVDAKTTQPSKAGNIARRSSRGE